MEEKRAAAKAPLYQTVMNSILEKVRKGIFSFDEPICTEDQLIEQFGVSRITVRRALSELEAQGVLYKKRGVGCFVCRDVYRLPSGAEGRNGSFAFVMPFNISQTGISVVYQAANAWLDENGACAIIYIPQHEESQWANFMLRQLTGMNVSGVAYYPKNGVDYGLLETFVLQGKSVVVLDEPTHSSIFSSVSSDNFTGGRLLGEYLAGLGHRDIVYITDAHPRERITVRDRISGMRVALGKVGASLPEERVITDLLLAADKMPNSFMIENVRKLYESGVTALCCVNDARAAFTIMACREAGLRVPEDISVTGFDDSEWASFLPELHVTTVRQDMCGIGREAARLLMASAGGRMENREYVVLPVTLVKGQSAGPRPRR